MAEDKRKPKIFYGWWIVLASAAAFAISGGFYLFGFSTFFLPLVGEFGWSRAATSGAFSLSRMEGGVLGPFGGFLVDKLGPRKIMLFGIALMGTGFILLSRINSLSGFYLAFILAIAVGTTLTTNQACNVAMANWFVKKRGMAIGFGQSGVGIGGILAIILTWFIVRYGWRPTAALTGFFLLLVSVPLSSVMRHRPEAYGCLPDGESKKEDTLEKDTKPSTTNHHSSSSDQAQGSGIKEADFTPRQALATSSFWLLTAAFGLRLFVTGAVIIHQIPFLNSIGIAPEPAAAMLASIAVISVAGRLGFGRLADMMEKRYVVAICMALIAIGTFILANARTWWQVIPFLIVYSPAYGGIATVQHAIRGEYFGRRHYGTIMGFMDLIQMFGTVLGPVFAGWIFDVTNSYRTAFLSFTLVTAIATVLVLLVRKPVLAENPYFQSKQARA